MKLSILIATISTLSSMPSIAMEQTHISSEVSLVNRSWHDLLVTMNRNFSNKWFSHIAIGEQKKIVNNNTKPDHVYSIDINKIPNTTGVKTYNIMDYNEFKLLIDTHNNQDYHPEYVIYINQAPEQENDEWDLEIEIREVHNNNNNSEEQITFDIPYYSSISDIDYVKKAMENNLPDLKIRLGDVLGIRKPI